MPKDSKKRKDDSDSDTSDTSIEQDPPPKKQKKAASSSSSSKKNDDGEVSWNLDKNRMVKIREFKGKIYIDIREYYESNGEMKPGKKGISLNTQQYQKLKGLIEEIDEELKKF